MQISCFPLIRSKEKTTTIKNGMFALSKLSVDIAKLAEVLTKHIEEKPVRQNCKECKCSKTSCLNFYCSCFANNLFCSGCSCENCKNTVENIEERNETLSRLSKSKRRVGELDTCKCSKTGCIKGYCPCFSQNKECETACVCLNCKNKKNASRKPELSVEKSELFVFPEEYKTSDNSKNTANRFFELSQRNQSSVLGQKRKRNVSRRLFNDVSNQPVIKASLGVKNMTVEKEFAKSQSALQETRSSKKKDDKDNLFVRRSKEVARKLDFDQ